MYQVRFAAKINAVLEMFVLKGTQGGEYPARTAGLCGPHKI